MNPAGPMATRRARALLEFRWPGALPSEKRAYMALWLGEDPTVAELRTVEARVRRGPRTVTP